MGRLQRIQEPRPSRKMASSLAMMSSNRFILGYGAAGTSTNTWHTGTDFPEPGVRVDIAKEKKFTYDGKYYGVTDVVNEPHLSKKIPLMIGGWGKRILSMAERYTDE